MSRARAVFRLTRSLPDSQSFRRSPNFWERSEDPRRKGSGDEFGDFLVLNFFIGIWHFSIGIGLFFVESAFSVFANCDNSGFCESSATLVDFKGDWYCPQANQLYYLILKRDNLGEFLRLSNTCALRKSSACVFRPANERKGRKDTTGIFVRRRSGLFQRPSLRFFQKASPCVFRKRVRT